MTESQIPELVAAFVRHQKYFGELSSEEAQWVIKNPKEAIKIFTSVIKKEYIKKNILMIESTYTVFVPSCSIADAIKIGNFGYVGLNEKDFSSDGSVCVGNKEMVLFNFDKFKRNISLEDAVKNMESAGYRPATFREFLAFLKNYKNRVDKFIVASGTLSSDGERVPVFSNTGRRDLETIFSVNLYLHEHCLFLGVLKNSSLL